MVSWGVFWQLGAVAQEKLPRESCQNLKIRGAANKVSQKCTKPKNRIHPAKSYYRMPLAVHRDSEAALVTQCVRSRSRDAWRHPAHTVKALIQKPHVFLWFSASCSTLPALFILESVFLWCVSVDRNLLVLLYKDCAISAGHHCWCPARRSHHRCC